MPLPVTSGLILDLAAADYADGATLSSPWVDRSGQGHAAIQDDPARCPVGGRDAWRSYLRFDGADDILSIPSFDLPRPFTVTVAYRARTGNSGRTISSAIGGFNWLLGSHTLGPAWHFANGSVGSPGGSPDTWYVMSAVDDEEGSIAYLDGSMVGSSSVVGVWGPSLFIGAAGGEFTEFGAVDVARVLVHDSALSAEDVASLATYLSEDQSGPPPKLLAITMGGKAIFVRG